MLELLSLQYEFIKKKKTTINLKDINIFYKQILTHKKRKCIPYIYSDVITGIGFVGFEIVKINDQIEERDEPNSKHVMYLIILKRITQ